MFALAKSLLVVCAAVTASAIELGPQDIVFHVFTRQNPTLSEPLLPTVGSISSTEYFSTSRPTVITIHNFGEDATGNFNAFLIPAHLSSEDVNVIAVDWSRGSALYSQGLSNSRQVGKVIADFINILISPFGYDPSLIRIVGVGLGGHITGIAARQVNGEIPHIIALDPSLIGWSHHPDKLNADDAPVVEVVHATSGTMGYDYPLGDLDFYPNGGNNQVHCGTDDSCSHIFSYAFYAESLTAEVNGGNKFVGTKCEDYEQARALHCDGDRDATFGGTETKTTEAGIYTFITNITPPFARG
ncbi:pancreatic triacylglycerol lipase-like [Pectinophora gossypiella]|uniref:Lipase domain-containing protein n=2 Tax=Pectinophora gossypiella TaxID=13191 RepID=A0A1E1VZ18_PECGO|nr:pancreatic triacylglycerol lipase-like [Pectinophora gossypiella]